jgi:hypothetical protein
MFSAADLIQTLQRRAQLHAHRLRPAGEFPPGWSGWFDAMRQRPGRITGAPAADYIEMLVQREPRLPPRRSADLTRWQAFSTLWRQEWQPAPREERGLRWFAGGVTAVWHVAVVALLAWLTQLQYLALRAMPAGEDVVQVEYIGVGTPAEPGGGEPASAPADASASAETAEAPESVATAASPTLEVAPPELQAPLPEVPQRDVPEPQLPPAAAEQPVAVTEPTPSTEPDDFVLSPPQPRTVDVPLATPQLAVPSRELQAVEVPEPVQLRQRALPDVAVAPRPLDAPVPEVATREVPAPLTAPRLPEIQTPSITPRPLADAMPQVRERAVPTPTPTPTPAAGSSGAQAAAPATVPRAADATPSAQAAPSTGIANRSPAPGTPSGSAGVGPAPTPAPGGWPSPRRSDDWGDSARDAPGGNAGRAPGVFGDDGSVRLADRPGSAAPGQPPGTVTEEIANLDRAGTWLKRAPNDYEPTAFDRYWRPDETLLQEWVRRSIKRVLIPIPGTSKRIACDVSLLALGGGCGIIDPNLNEQPATARPPPDIPFKPHLQEDNGSVGPGG